MVLYFSKMAEHYELGKKGEQLAVNYLIGKVYKIVERNWRFQKAEIDIIARIEDTLVIVEVRSRSSDFIENIAETVTPKKIKLLVMAADHYVTDNNLDVDVRFDIITILKNKSKFELEHLESAFYHF